MSRNRREGRYAGHCARHVRGHGVVRPSAFVSYCLRAERDNFLPEPPRRWYMSKRAVEAARAKLLAMVDRHRARSV